MYIVSTFGKCYITCVRRMTKKKSSEMKREQNAEEDGGCFIHFVSIIVLRPGTALRYDAIYLSERSHVSARAAANCPGTYLVRYFRSNFHILNYPTLIKEL